MAYIVTDFVEQLRRAHRQMKIRSISPQAAIKQGQVQTPEPKRPVQVTPHKPRVDYRLRASHM
jgi:hypothetical protein